MAIDASKYANIKVGYPIYHRPKDPFQPKIVAPADYGSRMREIYDLDHELDRFILRQSDYAELVVDAVASNIHQSTKIEGNPLSFAEVRRLTRNSVDGVQTPPAGEDVKSPMQEILNHVSIWASPYWMGLPWNIDLLKLVHRALLLGTAEESLAGKFREGENVPGEIVSSEQQVLFYTAPVNSIQPELESLITWVNETSIAMSPVAAASLFFHEFESIHPFPDGNGRTGRTFFHAYLQTNGLRNANLCMIEAELVKDPELYYRILAWTDYSHSYTDLIDYFTDAVLESYKTAHNRFSKKDLLSTGMDETAKRLLKMAKLNGNWFSISTASKWVDGKTEQTVRRHLNSLVDEGALNSKGRTRSKRYQFANPFAEMRKRIEAEVKRLQAEASASAQEESAQPSG